MSYNSAGLTKKIDYPNAASVEYLYDDANRIVSIRNIKSGADISKHLYTYDSNGNRLTMRESNIHIDQLINYGYDNADRLTSVQYPNNEKTEYILDKVGNRTNEIITGATPNSKTYSYNQRDQLTDITDTLGSTISYTYDNAGNQLTKDDNGTLTTFEYTARQRVKSITLGAQPPINYQYDYTGQRVNYQRNGIEKRYLYDGLTLIAETNTIGNTIARYHYGDRYQLAEQRNSINSYYHVDSMGTNVAVTNQDGSIAARYEYDAYGNLITQAGSSESPFGFTGYQKDEDTGLYYANARYYDSNTGRFLREDPFDGLTNNPPSLHRYLYANANPTRFIDPDGKYAEDGHYYTTLIVAEGLGFSAKEAMTLAFFSQLPDEVDEFDAIELKKGNYLNSELGNKMDTLQPFLHSLVTSGLSETETNITSKAIIRAKNDFKAMGFLIHRLGDTFSHRQLGNEKYLYETGYGHGRDGTEPDVLQKRPELYKSYVTELARTLAEVKGLSPEEYEKALVDIIQKTSRISNIPLTREKTEFSEFRGEYKINVPRSNSKIGRDGIKSAREELRKINIERISQGQEKLETLYRPEGSSISHLTGFDRNIHDVLVQAMKTTNRQVASTISSVRQSLKVSIKSLNDVRKIEVEEMVNSFKTFFVIESDENDLKGKSNE